LLSSPPSNWSTERKLEYFQWARAVVYGFTSPDQYLLNEFEKTCARISDLT
jgi:hypothetical protein